MYITTKNSSAFSTSICSFIVFPLLLIKSLADMMHVLTGTLVLGTSHYIDLLYDLLAFKNNSFFFFIIWISMSDIEMRTHV